MDDEQEEITAVPSLIIDGDEKEVSALYIRVRQVDELEKERVFKAISENLYLNRAVVSRSQEGAFLAFFNLNKRQNNHEMLAVKTALDIQRGIRNVKSLDIGFGINTGRAIASNAINGVINYTCLGNFVNIAKKLSSRSKQKILFTQSVHSKISNNLKAEEINELFDDFNIKIYSLSKIVDRERYNRYVKEFMNRMNI